jgi:hypothetical protein
MQVLRYGPGQKYDAHWVSIHTLVFAGASVGLTCIAHSSVHSSYHGSRLFLRQQAPSLCRKPTLAEFMPDSKKSRVLTAYAAVPTAVGYCCGSTYLFSAALATSVLFNASIQKGKKVR